MKEKVRCISPVGIAEPVRTFPLARRLDTIDGKNICMSICGEPDITIALEKKLRSEYPSVNWNLKKTYSLFPIPLTEEELKTTHAVIQGVLW